MAMCVERWFVIFVFAKITAQVLTCCGFKEIRVCKAVFVLTREYDVEDKLSLLALIPGGTYLVRRVAQWIAFGYLALDGYDDMV
jgi:hypothetical protein